MARPDELHRVKTITGLQRTTTRHQAGTVYYAAFKIKGHRRRPVLGSFASQEEAARALELAKETFRQELAAAERGPEVPEEKPADTRTLREAQQAQLKDRRRRRKRPLSERTLQGYEAQDKTALRFFRRFDSEWRAEDDPELWDSHLLHVTRARIEEWIDFRLDGGLEPSTVNRDLARLRAVMRWAEREGWLALNPINQVRQLEESEGRIRWLSDPEETRLQSYCPDWLWLFIRFALLTGFRQGEQLSLRWDQIHGGLIWLTAAQTKGKKGRTFPIEAPLAAVLQELKTAPNASDVWVFPNMGGTNRWSQYNLYKKWDGVRTEANLLDFRWHDFRHTFVSRLVQKGAKLEKVQELAGHENFQTTLRYRHFSPDHLRPTVALLT